MSYLFNVFISELCSDVLRWTVMWLGKIVCVHEEAVSVCVCVCVCVCWSCQAFSCYAFDSLANLVNKNTDSENLTIILTLTFQIFTQVAYKFASLKQIQLQKIIKKIKNQFMIEYLNLKLKLTFFFRFWIM